MNNYIAASAFVKRQTKESGYSHFDGSWERLEALVWLYISAGNSRSGYKDGVILVDLPPEGFYSAIIELNENSKLKTSYSPRSEGEAPCLRISAKGKKQPAKYASIVLYHKDVLDEDNDRSSDADWEIIAIKARTSEEEEPMEPYTMARNFLHLKGGTKGDFSAEQFAKSIVYWNNHAMSAGKPKWYRNIVNWFKRK